MVSQYMENTQFCNPLALHFVLYFAPSPPKIVFQIIETDFEIYCYSVSPSTT